MQVYYRQLLAVDKPRLLELFKLVPPTIARMSNTLVYKAIIDDALCSRNVVIFIASVENKLVGYFIAAWDWNYFTRMFVLRHPLVGVAVLTKKIKEKAKACDVPTNYLRAGDAGIPRVSENTIQKQSWEDSSKTIAKGIFMGVDPQMRSMGLGCGLYAHLIMYLKQRGFTRLDARIDKDNLPSINMHRKDGWTIIRDGCGFFAFLELGSERADGNE